MVTIPPSRLEELRTEKSALLHLQKTASKFIAELNMEIAQEIERLETSDRQEPVGNRNQKENTG